MQKQFKVLSKAEQDALFAENFSDWCAYFRHKTNLGNGWTIDECLQEDMWLALTKPARSEPDPIYQKIMSAMGRTAL